MSMLYPIRNYVTSLPVKAFEYMTCGIPMVMSNFPYWQEIFADCARFADPYDSRQIAEQILCLLEDPQACQRMGDAGRTITRTTCNWAHEATRLVQLYSSLLDEQGS